MSARSRLACLSFLLLTFAGALAARGDCTSSTGCTDCFQDRRGIASCSTVNASASCSCSVQVEYPSFCLLEGACNYQSGGGGVGAAGGGSGGGTCARSPGGWCPASCASCTTVYWY